LAKRGRKGANRLNSAAIGIGRTFGKLTAQVDALNRQRAVVASELRQVISSARDMLADLGDDAAIARHAGRKAVRKATAKGRKVKRNLSPEGRAAIIAAVKRRWARQKAAAKK
jgi:hypothetical protein